MLPIPAPFLGDSSPRLGSGRAVDRDRGKGDEPDHHEYDGDRDHAHVHRRSPRCRKGPRGLYGVVDGKCAADPRGGAELLAEDLLDATLGRIGLLLRGDAPDVAAATEALALVQEQMAQLRAKTAEDLRARIEALDELDPLEHDRLLACIDRGEFDQVDNELSYLENDEPLPPPDDHTQYISAFYPAVVDALKRKQIEGRVSHYGDKSRRQRVRLSGAWVAPARMAERRASRPRLKRLFGG